MSPRRRRADDGVRFVSRGINRYRRRGEASPGKLTVNKHKLPAKPLSLNVRNVMQKETMK